MIRGKRHVRTAGALVTVVASAGALAVVAHRDPPLAAGSGSAARPQVPRLVTSVATSAPLSSGCGPAVADDAVRDGRPMVVSMPPAPPFVVGTIPAQAWHRPAVQDPTWQMRFLGLSWMLPLARRAAADGQTGALAALVDQAVEFHRQNPDRGSATRGWDEGTAMRRLSALNCLYALTGSRRLRPAMAANAAVQFGPRYYGPPFKKVHNHGVMADLVVLRAARLLDNERWRRVATERLKAQAPLAWSAKGTTWEQSTMYQARNVELWSEVADALEVDDPHGAEARAIRALVSKADRVRAWMTEPDGRLTVLGDANDEPGTSRSRWTARTWHDDATGFGIGRWSWSDPATAYYTVRYGPPVAAHGHQDRGGVTWSDLGVRVLVTAGLHTYDASNPFIAYQDGPESNNVAFPSGAVLDEQASVRLTRTRFTVAAHAWVLTDRLFGVAHRRTIVVEGPQHRLTVRDSFARGGTYLQKFHLAPGWRFSSLTGDGRVARFAGPGGRTLVVTTTGSIRRVRGAVQPVAGWHFPRFRQRVATEELTVDTGPRVSTAFTLS